MPLVDYSQLIILFLVLLGSLAVHDAAQAWLADMLGDPTPAGEGRLSLSPAVHLDPVGTVLFPVLSFATGQPFAGWSRPVPVDRHQLGAASRRKFAVIVAAGPVSHLALAVVAALLIRSGAAAGSGIGAFIAPLLFRAVDLNVLLTALNLVPIPPLDGGLLLAELLPAPSRWLARLNRFRVLILFGLMLSGVLWSVINPIRFAVLAVLF